MFDYFFRSVVYYLKGKKTYSKIDLKEAIKSKVLSFITQSLVVIIGILFFFVIFVKDEGYVIPLFVADCIAIVVFIAIKESSRKD